MKDILVVDDDFMMLEVISRILAVEGIRATCVSSGAEALVALRERAFPLMITDFNMPELDGLELSRQGLELDPDMRIIMDTSGLSSKEVSLAKEIGIAKILVKPFLPAQMLETIHVVMNERDYVCI